MDDKILHKLTASVAVQGEQIGRLQSDVSAVKKTVGEIRDTLNIQKGQRKAIYAVLLAGIPGGGIVGGLISKLLGGE